MKNNINISIKAIRDKGFFVDESIVIVQENKIAYQIQSDMDISAENNEVKVTYGVSFSQEEKVFLSGKVSTFFQVESLKEYWNETEQNYAFPEQGLIILMGLAFSHTRAILAKNTAGTLYESYILPIVDPKQLISQK